MDREHDKAVPFWDRSVPAKDRVFVMERLASTGVPGADRRLDAILDAMRRDHAAILADPGLPEVRFPAARRSEVEAAVREAGGTLITLSAFLEMSFEETRSLYEGPGFLMTETDKASGDEVAMHLRGTASWRRALLEKLAKEPLNCVRVEEPGPRSDEAAGHV